MKIYDIVVFALGFLVLYFIVSSIRYPENPIKEQKTHTIINHTDNLKYYNNYNHIPQSFSH